MRVSGFTTASPRPQIYPVLTKFAPQSNQVEVSPQSGEYYFEQIGYTWMKIGYIRTQFFCWS